MAIPGIGPVTATAIIAAIGNGAAFKRAGGFRVDRSRPGRIHNRRQAEAAGDSKRGNSYLRRLFMQGARAVLQQSDEAVFRSECVAGATHSTNAPERRCRGPSQ